MFPQQPNQQQPTQGLPVSPQQLNQQFFIHGAPNNVNIPVQINVPPQLQGMIPMAVGYVVHELQSKSQRNALRIFAFNMMSMNGWQNPEFSAAVQSVLEYAVVLATSSQQQPQAAIAMSAETVIGVMSAVYAKKYMLLYQYIQPDVAQDVDIKMQQYTQIRAAIMNLKGMQQQQPQWQQPQPQWQQPTTQVGLISGQQFKPTPGFSPFAGNSAAQMAVTPTPQMLHQPAPNTNNLAVPVFGLSNLASQAVQLEQPAPKKVAKEKITFGFQKPTVLELSAPAQQTVTPPTWPLATYPEPADFQPMPDIFASVEPEVAADTPYMVVDDHREVVDSTTGTRTRFADSSDWERTVSALAPYSTIYSKITHASFHRMAADGSIGELLVDIDELGEEMDYLVHETRPTFAPKLDVYGALPVIPNWIGVSNVLSSDLLLQECDGAAAEVVEPLAIPQIINAFSSDHAETLASVILLRDDFDINNLGVLEYYYNVVNAKVLDTDFTTIFKHVEKVKTVAEAVSAMVEMISVIPDRLWCEMHDKVTVRCNQALAVSLQLPEYSVESFVDDIEAVIEAIRSERGELFADAISDNINDIVGGVFRVLIGDELSDLASNLFAKDFISEAARSKSLLAIATLNSATHVNWKASDMNFQMNETVCVVRESATPALHSAVAGIFNRTNEMSGVFTDRFIITADNVRLRLFKGYIGNSCYLISK